MQASLRWSTAAPAVARDAEALGIAPDVLVSYANFPTTEYLDLDSIAWLEELGCKATNTHLYLMEPALAPAGQTRPGAWVLRELARSTRSATVAA